MNCEFCGQELSDDMLFCTRCGRPTPLAGEEAPAFVESPDATGPLPRLDDEGNPVEGALAAEEDDLTEEAATGAEEDDAAAEVAEDAERFTEQSAALETSAEATAGDDADASAEAAAKEAQSASDVDAAIEEASGATVAPASAGEAGSRATADVARSSSTVPVVAVHKSRVPLVIGSVIVALVVGCACVVGGLYVAKTGALNEIFPGLAVEQPAEPATAPEPAAPEDPAAASGDAAPVEPSDDEEAPGVVSAEEVSLAVQEGWEALIANEFSDEARQAWMETVLSLQPTGVLEAYEALVGIEGDSLLPLYLYDDLPLAYQQSVEDFLQGDTAAVTVQNTPAGKSALAAITVYFGELGQSVAGQVEQLDLPLEVTDAFVLGLEIAPTSDGALGKDTVAINEGTDGYLAYEYDGRWYLLAPQLERTDV